MLATKLTEKLPEKIPSNAGEYCNSYLKRKNTKSVKWSKIITKNPKNFWKPKRCWHKISYYEHPKTSVKLSKTIRKAGKLSQIGSGKRFNTPLFCGKKSENFLNGKNGKIRKRAHAFKGYTSSYNVKILNSFSPELQLKVALWPCKKIFSFSLIIALQKWWKMLLISS